MSAISFFVAGTPETQGSTRAFVVGGRAITTSTNRRNADWRKLVAACAQEHFDSLEERAPVDVSLHFILRRPKSARKRALPTKRPDLDKLIRSCLDALTGIVYRDDSQVCDLTVRKRYAEAGQQTGVRIIVRY